MASKCRLREKNELATLRPKSKDAQQINAPTNMSESNEPTINPSDVPNEDVASLDHSPDQIADGEYSEQNADQYFDYQAYRMPWYLRTLLGSVGVMLAVLLITAAFLAPSKRGFGTHQQLGLAPCSFKTMFNGMPCPSCGMTTSWAHLTKGQIVSSLRANPGGTYLGILSVVMSPWLIMTGIKGNWFMGEPPAWLAMTIGGSLLTVIFSNWIYQLMK